MEEVVDNLVDEVEVTAGLHTGRDRDKAASSADSSMCFRKKPARVESGNWEIRPCFADLLERTLLLQQSPDPIAFPPGLRDATDPTNCYEKRWSWFFFGVRLTELGIGGELGVAINWDE